MFKLHRLLPLGLVAATATMITTGSAQAALLTSSATNCPNVPEAQTFLPWNDSSEYQLAPDGNFAGLAATWSLSGGAAAVAGGDGYTLAGQPASTESLSLPSGSSATTPVVCVGVNDPTIRFFAENSGSSSSTLLVSATMMTTLGLQVTLPIGDISATGTWEPSPVLAIAENLLTLLPNNQTPVTFSFSPQGSRGSWEVDDLYVDPMGGGGG